jgi:hypothetical protein
MDSSAFTSTSPGMRVVGKESIRDIFFVLKRLEEQVATL